MSRSASTILQEQVDNLAENEIFKTQKAMVAQVGVGIELLRDGDLDGVRRQSFWDNGLGKLREALAHQFGDFRRPAAGAASGGWRWSVV